MKKVVGISLGVFVVIIVIIFAMWFGSMQKNEPNQNLMQNLPEVKEQPIVVLDLQEIAKHSTKEDCWTIVRGKVYNVTSFASKHPGGEGAILYNCGKDGTKGFEERGGKGPHPEKSLEVLAQYFVGDFVTSEGK